MDFKTYMDDTVNAMIPYTIEELQEIKASLTESDLKKLIETQSALVETPLQTITKYEKILSDNPNLYESYSIYTWPNPDTEDGMPYIIRDGYVNYDHIKGSKESLRLVSFLTYHLGILYYLTNDKTYYDALRKQLFSFFIDEKTKILPDFRHGQAHIGINEGQSGGIIDIAISFGYSLSILHALNQEGKLDEELYTGMRDWMKAKLEWLNNHPFGKEMAEKPNNHSVVYDYYTMMIGIFIGDEKPVERAKQRLNEVIMNQICEDGSMPLELKRFKSRSYTSMNTKLIFEVYKLSKARLDESIKERFKKAIEFYLPYASGREEWPYQQTQEYYQFYDINFVYHANKYFGYSKEVFLKEYDAERSLWTILLYKSILNIKIK